MARPHHPPPLSTPRFLSALMRMNALRYACPTQQNATPLENQRIATQPCASLVSILRNHAHPFHHLSASMRKVRHPQTRGVKSDDRSHL
jgi:hypothetical protein